MHDDEPANPADTPTGPGPGPGPVAVVAEAHPPAAAPVDVDLFGRPPRRTADWSHRRGEPRGLALAWTTYLLLASVVALGSSSVRGMMHADVYRPAARRLIVLVAIGLVVLWPLLRLAQHAPARRPVGSVLRDAAVLLVPLALLLLPQSTLAVWPLGVVAWLLAWLATWTLAVGALVAAVYTLAHAGGAAATQNAGPGPAIGGTPRVLVALLVAAAAAWPLAWLLGTPGSLSAWRDTLEPAWPWLASPVLGAYDVVADRPWTGRAATVAPGHQRALLAAVVATALAWSGTVVLRVATARARA